MRLTNSHGNNLYIYSNVNWNRERYMNNVVPINKPDNDTIPDTLWSATLLEMLIDALRLGKSDEKILPLVHSLFYKQFSSRYIFSRVRRDLDKAACARLKDLLMNL